MGHRSFSLILTLALGAAPLAAQTTAADRPARLEAIETARAAGEYDRATALMEPLLAAAPDDPDLLRRMAMIDAAAGRLDKAQQRIDVAARAAPDDLDIALARGFILAWSGREDEARQMAEAVAARDPDYPELAVLRQTLARQENREGLRLRAVSVGAGLSDITLDSGASSTWSSQNAVIAVDLADRDTITVGLAREKRRAVDTRLSARIDRRIDGGFVYLGATAVPNPDFQERWSVSGGGEFALSPNLTAVGDTRLARYDTGTILAFQPGLRYLFAQRASLTGRAIAIFDGGEQRFGGSARLDFALPNEGTLFAIAASYPDAEADGVRQLRSAAAGVTWPLSQRVALTAAGSHEDRKNSYRRWSGTLALTFRFDSR